MTDYIKVPTFPTQDLLREVEAVSPYPRINPQQPHQEGYPRQSADPAAKDNKRSPRRFMALRRLIHELKKHSQITKIDYATMTAELRQQGTSIADTQLISMLQQLRVPVKTLQSLLLQIEQNPSSVKLAGGYQIETSETLLFPVSTKGMVEFNLIFDDLYVWPGNFASHILENIEQDGIFVEKQHRVRLIFRRSSQTSEAGNELLKLKISIQLGVMESDDADRRAILYPRGEKNYALYSDKLINLSI